MLNNLVDISTLGNGARVLTETLLSETESLTLLTELDHLNEAALIRSKTADLTSERADELHALRAGVLSSIGTNVGRTLSSSVSLQINEQSNHNIPCKA